MSAIMCLYGVLKERNMHGSRTLCEGPWGGGPTNKKGNKSMCFQTRELYLRGIVVY